MAQPPGVVVVGGVVRGWRGREMFCPSGLRQPQTRQLLTSGAVRLSSTALDAPLSSDGHVG